MKSSTPTGAKAAANTVVRADLAAGLAAGSRALLLAGVGLTALVAGPALAQVDDKPIAVGTVRVGGDGASGFTVQAPADAGYNASEILSATRTAAALSDVPQAVTVVTRQQIEDLASQSMADVVRYVPGVTFAQGEGNRDTPVFRGNSSTSDFFVDGLRDDVQYYRDVYNIERVEVLKGPNAMIFGRGGAGGIINRVTKQADWREIGELRLETGSYDHYRGAVDLGRGVSDAVALRVTGLYEDSDTYRDGVDINRWGINPTAAIKLGGNTLIGLGYEHFEDERVADRGVPSLNGRPLKTDPSTFFGDPSRSPVTAEVDAVDAVVEHHFAGGAILRNRTRWADYDKFYQNVFPGAVNAADMTVSISAYSNATRRRNLFNQTDLNLYFDTGSVRHTVLAGVEVGRQETENLRMTGYFTGVSPTTTSIKAPVAAPTVSVPVSFAQSATDASNTGTAEYVAVYAQDQIELTSQLQAVVGLRYDAFDVDFLNRRTNDRFKTSDGLWSPRAGLIYKPADAVSLYASYSLTYVPRAGEQLSSLAQNNASLEPEQFTNYELGVKWDAQPDLTITAAVYQLDRTNVAIQDPAFPLDPTRQILVDGQRTKGVELGASGQITDKWSVIAAYAWQDGEITRGPLAGAALANLPEHAFSLWNRYDATDALGFGLGVIRQSSRFASTDNLVELPGFTRVDGAVFYDLNDKVALQLNVENLLDEAYWANAHSNNNITPGSPRAFKLGLTARF